ncbi:unnamed protein product [Clonostachys rosea]|uniref:F-box domain-containing protein n=1 Tax=Bionectria ochroleuca TaxID=29856 RepID=A0ABY6UAA0_BIOOC|nr:unnamed protein product [Clonostachys rosea]
MATTDQAEGAPPIRRLLQNARPALHHLEAQVKRTISTHLKIHNAVASKGNLVVKPSAYDVILPRMLRRKKASRPSLDMLDPELILIIFNMVREDDWRSMRNLALLNSYYHYAARYCQHRDATFYMDSPHQHRFQDRLAYIEKHDLTPAIRSMTVYALPMEEDENFIDSLVQLMQKATGLRDLAWRNASMFSQTAWQRKCRLPPVVPVGIPEKIVLAVQPRGSVRLHASIAPIDDVPWPVPDARVPTYIAPLLARSDSLHSLNMDFSYGDEESCIKLAQTAKQILLSCPNVRKLIIDYGPWNDGSVSFPLPTSYIGFGFADGERPPALEDLELLRYEFGYEKEVEPGYTGGSHVGYPGKGHESDYWAEVFDWSRLKRLRTKNVEFALKLAPKLTSIEHVVFDEPRGTEKIGDFCGSIPRTLQSITIPKFSALGLDGITRHGPSLRALRIHQKETRTWAGETIDASSLLKVQRECPLIEELDLDISRNGDWPYDALEVLVGFPKLRVLTIWFEMGWVGREPDDIVKPLVTYPAVDELYRHICGKQYVGVPSKEVIWADVNRIGFVCRLLERGDDMSDLVFDIYCPRLSDKDNSVISQMRKPTKSGRFNRGSRPQVQLMGQTEVAMHGPPPFVSQSDIPKPLFLTNIITLNTRTLRKRPAAT